MVGGWALGGAQQRERLWRLYYDLVDNEEATMV